MSRAIVFVAIVAFIALSASGTSATVNINFANLLAGLDLDTHSGTPSTPPASSNEIVINILQLNDIYELSPVVAGTLGGLARVQTFKKQLIAKNPHGAEGVISAIAGDFISPSAITNAIVDAQDGRGPEKLFGKQMIAAFNAMELDLVTLGNHEFDGTLADLQARIDESHFVWTVCNSWQNTGVALHPKILPYYLVNRLGVRLLFVGAVMSPGTQAYQKTTDCVTPGCVNSGDGIAIVKSTFQSLVGQYDIGIAITHWVSASDMNLALSVGGNWEKAAPLCHLILGGHEHVNQMYKRNYITIAKADSNSQTAWVHTITVDATTKKLKKNIESEIVPITDKYAEDAAVKAVTTKWENWAYAYFATPAGGSYNMDAVVTNSLTHNIDASNLLVNYGPSEMGDLMCSAILAAGKSAAGGGADVALSLGQLMRLDDWLYAPIVKQVNVFQMLPLDNKLQVATVAGSQLLADYLTKLAVTNIGNRATYTTVCGFTRNPTTGVWTDADGADIVSSGKTYRIAYSDRQVQFATPCGATGGGATCPPVNPNFTQLPKAVMSQLAVVYPPTP